MTLCYKGRKATFSIVTVVAKSLIEQGDNKSLKVLNLERTGPKACSKGWVLKNVPQQQEK